MSIKRSTRFRLRVEALEGREVPATLTAIDNAIPDPTGAAADVAVLSDAGPTDPGSEVTVTNELDGTPEAQQIDLAVFATVDKIKPSLGDTVTIRFTIQNNGDVPASGVMLTATLPDGLKVLSTQASDGTYDSGASEWTAGIIYPGAPVTMTIKARVTDSSEQVVSASLSASDQADPNTENNSATLTMTPVLGGVSVSQVASQSVATINGTVTFTVVVKNSGPGTARNLAIQESLPSGLTWVRVMTPDRGSFDVKTKTWNIAWLLPGTKATLQFVAQVHKTGRLEATSSLSATGIDETRSRLQASASVVGTKTNSPATWTYTGPGYQPGQVMPAIAKPLQPVLSQSILAQLAAYLKLLQSGV